MRRNPRTALSVGVALAAATGLAVSTLHTSRPAPHGVPGPTTRAAPEVGAAMSAISPGTPGATWAAVPAGDIGQAVPPPLPAPGEGRAAIEATTAAPRTGAPADSAVPTPTHLPPPVPSAAASASPTVGPTTVASTPTTGPSPTMVVVPTLTLTPSKVPPRSPNRSPTDRH